jgi:Methyltransferase domain
MHSELQGASSLLEFWENRYRAREPGSSGRPSFWLERFCGALPPGRALELGCAVGDDALWLASWGWQVLGVDISATAVARAGAEAARRELSAKARFEQRDLMQSVPEGAFELVVASYLQSPGAFDTADIVRRASRLVVQGGWLMVALHASAPPWAVGGHDHTFPNAQETWAALELNPSAWTREICDRLERQVTGPQGQTAAVADNVLLARRAG